MSDSSLELEGNTEKDLPDSLLVLGKKARERLVEERSKRPEIVRLDTENLFPEAGKASVTVAIGGSGSPRKQVLRRKRRRGDRIVADTADDTDKWMPDISRVLKVMSDDERSTVVALHGLPTTTTAQNIQRFFLGLAIQRITLLLPWEKHIPELDAEAKTGKSIVKRYPTTFRVWVKFDKTTTAAAALQRTGEAIEGGSVALTMVPRQIASFGLNNLAFGAQDSLSTSMSTIIDRVNRTVPHILWAAVGHFTAVNVDAEVRLYLSGIHSAVYGPHKKRLEEHLKALYSLIEEYPTLRRPDCWDHDPSTQLSIKARNHVESAIDYAEDLIRRASFLLAF